jgi:hypothetical protein
MAFMSLEDQGHDDVFAELAEISERIGLVCDSYMGRRLLARDLV